MIKKISIKNYKSIVDDEIELGRVNVFIGANGAGKSNILEAVAMFSTAQGFDLSVESLYNKGVRVTKPNLMFSSFLGKKQKNSVKIDIESSENIKFSSEIIAKSPDDIYTKWSTIEREKLLKKLLKKVKEERTKVVANLVGDVNYEELSKEEAIPIMWGGLPEVRSYFFAEELPVGTTFHRFITYQIYTLSTPALRGITQTSKKQPLGLNGENLDILLSTFDDEEWQLLMDHSHFISWMEDVITDKDDRLKFEGHKLGRSTSTLYFVDQFMRKNNNIFAAENANEGALHILFYLALFISKKTPSFFAIDNIETALNPKICRALIKSIAELAKLRDKQVLITTHNPAVLDGINLNDDQQRLFVVSRTDEGHTKTERIKLKPGGNQNKRKLSEYWMRGDLGGLPNNFL